MPIFNIPWGNQNGNLLGFMSNSLEKVIEMRKGDERTMRLYLPQIIVKLLVAILKKKRSPVMNSFEKTLDYVNKVVYEPNQLTVSSTIEEKQNAKYGGGRFQLSTKTVRFRVAKTTPAKIGQFVAFWEKDENNKNQPFSFEAAPDLLVINTSTSDNLFGQFIFPKEVLLKQNILSSTSTKGKMGIRIYPSWDSPTSQVALTTQAWQLAYFIDLSNTDKLPVERILELYS